MTEETVTHPRPILALVTDLFFTLKIGDIAKAVGCPFTSPEAPRVSRPSGRYPPW
jgi:hypothetical protein